MRTFPLIGITFVLINERIRQYWREISQLIMRVIESPLPEWAGGIPIRPPPINIDGD